MDEITVYELRFEPPPEGGFGGHEFGYEDHTDLFRCELCGRYEVSVRDHETGQIQLCPGPPDPAVLLDAPAVAYDPEDPHKPEDGAR